MSDPRAALEQLIRDEGRRVLATLVRTLGDFQLAEDAVQDATVEALVRWPVSGVPAEPRAWLTRTARHRALDRLRREATRTHRETESMNLLIRDEPDPPPRSVVRDDQLRLLFTCCHPALSLDAQVALSLRVLGGLTTPEIAQALLVPEATMTKRLTRAKQKIARAHIPYRVPADHELPERLAGVLAVVYLVFTEGHRATTGAALLRLDLSDEAVRLARTVCELMPDEDEALGLLALLLLSDARRGARLDGAGEVVLLADQDRTLWDRTLIDEGLALLDLSLRHSQGVAGPYVLQAALAACHATAPSFAATDWAEVVRLYDILLTVHPSPVVALNRAVAVAERDGPAVALAEVEAIDGLRESAMWHAARADLLTRTGDVERARVSYAQALARGPADPERRLLERRRAGLDDAAGSDLGFGANAENP